MLRLTCPCTPPVANSSAERAFATSSGSSGSRSIRPSSTSWTTGAPASNRASSASFSRDACSRSVRESANCRQAVQGPRRQAFTSGGSIPGVSAAARHRTTSLASFHAGDCGVDRVVGGTDIPDDAVGQHSQPGIELCAQHALQPHPAGAVFPAPAPRTRVPIEDRSEHRPRLAPRARPHAVDGTRVGSTDGRRVTSHLEALPCDRAGGPCTRRPRCHNEPASAGQRRRTVDPASRRHGRRRGDRHQRGTRRGRAATCAASAATRSG